MKIGIFYGSTMGNTENIAGQIAEKLGVSSADLHNVADSTAAQTAGYDLLLLGSSTWGAGELQDDWYDFLAALKNESLSGKKVALFGCGDSGGYPDTFCDAVGIIYDDLAATGCAFVGAMDSAGYGSTSSAICRAGKFVGLAIDESDSDGANRARLDEWVALVKNA